jgi:hypothetical protein
MNFLRSIFSSEPEYIRWIEIEPNGTVHDHSSPPTVDMMYLAPSYLTVSDLKWISTCKNSDNSLIGWYDSSNFEADLFNSLASQMFATNLYGTVIVAGQSEDGQYVSVPESVASSTTVPESSTVLQEVVEPTIDSNTKDTETTMAIEQCAIPVTSEQTCNNNNNHQHMRKGTFVKIGKTPPRRSNRLKMKVK